jgi:hypothetical protein
MDVPKSRRHWRLRCLDNLVHTVRWRSVWVCGRRSVASTEILPAIWRSVLRLCNGLGHCIFRVARNNRRMGGITRGRSFDAIVFALGFGAIRSLLKLTAVLFLANSAGYFIGSTLNEVIRGRIGMLSWGLVYGLFLGAGIGMVLHICQTSSANSSNPIPAEHS